MKVILMKPEISRIVAMRTEIKENDERQTMLADDSVFKINNKPVMELVLDALSIIGKHKEIAIRARGELILNAVTVALIITEKMMKGNSKIHKITVDSESIQELGQAQSNIEIILRKI